MRMKDPDRMRSEFFVLHPVLQLIICDIINWGIEHGEEPTFTCFMRTAEEQQALVDAGEAKDKVSVHMFGRGADFRIFKNDNLNLLVDDYVNQNYPYGDGIHKSCLRHIGTADHFHLQCMD